MNARAEHHGTGVILDWDRAEGVGVVRTDESERLVWIHFSMHASEGESLSVASGLASVDRLQPDRGSGRLRVGRRARGDPRLVRELRA
ncbi:hypothetical protein [Demequina litorisediminis]|uniref:hypothetical protein n=1 Tax=Demequina litorisediminis TaxID=1849022 RepID=UPI0024E13C6E|nr:hypothetical protein [Demequina litorisediminis]